MYHHLSPLFMVLEGGGVNKIPVSLFSCEFYASNNLQFSPGVILFLL